MRFNTHTHHKPNKRADETGIRNAYHCLTVAQIAALTYPVSVGVHPWHSANVEEADWERLNNYFALPNVWAMGEVGLDRAIVIPIKLQMEVLDRQWQLAEAHQLPLIVHSVRAYSDLMPWLKRRKTRVIIHQFSGNRKQAQACIDLGVYLSFGKLLWQTQHAQTAAWIPTESLLLETDTSRISLRDVYAQAAKLRQTEVNLFTEAIGKNVGAVFLKF